MMNIFLLNAFSLQMVQEFPVTISVEEVSFQELYDSWAEVVSYHKKLKSHIVSAIGHADTAAVLGVPMNRINVSLQKGDVAYVAQLQGGRLPEGSTTLPQGFSFKLLKVTVG